LWKSSQCDDAGECSFAVVKEDITRISLAYQLDPSWLSGRADGASVLPRLDHVSYDGRFAQRLARLKAVQPFDEDESVPVAPDQNWRLLTNFQHARGDLLNHFGLERCSSLDRNIDVRDRKRLTLDHGLHLNCEALIVASSDASVFAQIGAGTAAGALALPAGLHERPHTWPEDAINELNGDLTTAPCHWAWV
jgi:hypothetical protein